MKRQRTLSLAVFAFLSSNAVGAPLIGVVPGEPLFNYNSGGTTTYDGVTGSLVVNATPLNYTQVGGVPLDIFFLQTAPSVSLNISLDTACNLVGGNAGDDLTVTGDIDLNADFVPEISGTLLTGEIVGFGVGPAPATIASFDARFAITGGELVTSGDYTLGSEVGMTLTVEGNNFTGACDVAWNGGAKGKIGFIQSAVPPTPICFDVKKIKIRDGKKHYRHMGSYGNSKSKIMASLSAGCPAGFDPTQSLISLSMDGETFAFPVGSFAQVGSSNKYRAWVAGSPALDATLNCDRGKFSFSASKADTSQIDNSDGVDVTLVLGDSSATRNVVLQATGHYYSNRGQNNVLYYHNDNPLDCSATPGDDESDIHELKIRHRASGRIHTYKRSKGGYGMSCLVSDSISGQYASFDTSKTSTLTCGDGDANFEVVGIEHSTSSKSCTLLDEVEEDDDVEDNQYN
ncbi:MAG TPA: hypothetical protein ENI74_00575 [Gammaproteobacteria bacterium]|nr:hypothetical protein [Gammaproteobacteria bacterium]